MIKERTEKQQARHEYYLKNRDKLLQESSERYFKDKEHYLEYQREYRKENRSWVRDKTNIKRRNRIRDAVLSLGDKCNKCGIAYPDCVYDFHHTDPTTKEFTIGENALVSTERFFAEVKKCQLLCANCHRIEHNIKNEN